MRLIGKAVLAARKERGVEQSELGTLMGCSQEMIAQIESGKKEPGDKLLAKIERWLSGS